MHNYIMQLRNGLLELLCNFVVVLNKAMYTKQIMLFIYSSVYDTTCDYGRVRTLALKYVYNVSIDLHIVLQAQESAHSIYLAHVESFSSTFLLKYVCVNL